MLTIHDLSFGYGQSLVIDNLSWELEPGSVHGLVGMNGAGKTTLFKLITGSLKFSAGSISAQPEPFKFSDCGFMETHTVFYPMLTGMEYLKIFQLKNRKFKIEEWNQVFRLPLNDVIDNYSTGMQKKLSLMGIIALNRQFLILDEPFNGLDFESVRLTRKILRKLAENGQTIIVSSHIPETLTTLCDTLSMISKGKIEFKIREEEFSRFENLADNMLENEVLPEI